MRFVVDAQLPRRLCTFLSDLGHDCVHTLDLPDGNRTPDQDLARLADNESRALITKDEDFVLSRIASGSPKLLLLVSTGNIQNSDLLALFGSFLSDVEGAFHGGSFVELSREFLVIHE